MFGNSHKYLSQIIMLEFVSAEWVMTLMLFTRFHSLSEQYKVLDRAEKNEVHGVSLSNVILH